MILQRISVPALVLAALVAPGCGAADDGATAEATTTSTSAATTSSTTTATTTTVPVVADGVEQVGEALLPTGDTPTVGVSLFLDASGRPDGPPVLYDGLALAQEVFRDASSDEEVVPGRQPTDLATQLLDGDGRILLSIPVVESERGDRRARIVYTEPIEREMATLRIVRGDEIVHEREATASAPVVEVLQPTEGGSLDARRFEITYDVLHPDGADVSIFVNVVDQHGIGASLDYDAPPDRFEFAGGPGIDRLPLADGPVDVYVGAFDGTRATLVIRTAQLG